MIIETHTHPHSYGDDLELIVDGHTYVSGTPSVVLERRAQIIAVQARYINEGCPAWDACKQATDRLGLPTSYREDLTVIDLHFMMGEQQISRRIAHVAELYPQNHWYLWGRGYLEAISPALAADILAHPVGDDAPCLCGAPMISATRCDVDNCPVHGAVDATPKTPEQPGLKAGEYDTALPQTWVDSFYAATEFNPVGNFVWSYASASIFGEPFPLTETARATLARYEGYVEAEDEHHAGA